MFDSTRFASYNDYNDYLTRKLAHYNEWLGDPKRTFKDGPYPGFPEDLEHAARIQSFKKAAAQEFEKKANPPIERKKKSKKAKKTADGGPTKQERAVDIFKRLSGEKAATIQAIQDELGMSLAGAPTYFYNAKKLV